MSYTLYIGNKNYSSWSMRPWIVMQHFAIPFEEKWIHFDNFDENSKFKQTVLTFNPFGCVPFLVVDDFVITDSLAICEYLAEQHSALALWPTDIKQRAQARSLTAHMHTGYQKIRQYLPFNIEAQLPEIGKIILRDHLPVKKEIEFLDNLLSRYLKRSQGNYLFGNFTIADAFYAPLCLRLKNYQIQVSDDLLKYIQTLCSTHGITQWIDAALKEHHFVAINEPYRFSR